MRGTPLALLHVPTFAVTIVAIASTVGAAVVGSTTAANASPLGFAPAAAQAGGEAAPAESPAAPPPRPGPAASPTGGGGTGSGVAFVDAATALEHARAAYEYGEIDEVVESARPVAEGRLESAPAERAQALRYLGIGLFLTGRRQGAETAFFELLRMRPDTRLDPRTTRPDAVAFFEQVRRRHHREIADAARANNPKSFLLNFLPPLGQFQNGHRGRGYTIAALEIVSLAAAITSVVLLETWERPDKTFGDSRAAETLRTVNWSSVGVLALTYVVGVIDGIANYGDPAPGSGTETARLEWSPGGLRLRF